MRVEFEKQARASSALRKKSWRGTNLHFSSGSSGTGPQSLPSSCMKSILNNLMGSNKEKIQIDPKTAAVFQKKGYEVLNQIGEGAFGKVYKARSTKDGVMTAVKVMDTTKMPPKFREQFLPREIDMLTKIRHPSVLEIYDIFRSAGKIYIFMEFAPNGSLTSKLKNGPLPEHEAKKWFRQITEGIYFMHKELRICHRDIKTDNILLDANNNAKLCDYGFAREVSERDGVSRTLCGTAPYYCPEMIENGKYDPFKADCWALGVMLFVMLTQKFPFRWPAASKADKAEWREMVDAQKKGLYRAKPAFQALPDPAKDLIFRLLHPDPNQRLDAQMVLKHGWTNIHKR